MNILKLDEMTPSFCPKKKKGLIIVNLTETLIFFLTGYGDIHAVNTREMIFIMIYVSFDMILSAYLIGNMTALIVKGSKTERFRDKMKEVIRYMNRNKLEKGTRDQIKGHLRLQHESSYTEASVLEDIPVSIRSKVSTTYYLIVTLLST